MNEETRQDLTINGAGTVGGGRYRDIRINGSGDITGDVDCRTLTINGAGKVDGTVTGGTVLIRGAGTLGRVQGVETLHMQGGASIEGVAEVKTLRVEGAAKLHGSLTAEEMDIRGAISVHGDCTAERFVTKGGFAIDGLLNADTIDITLHGECRAREIGGSSLCVGLSKHPLSKLDKLFHAFTDHRLIADTIEGDAVSLEYTTASVVRGKRLVIGPGCAIALAEYSESCEVSPDAQVKQQTKTTAPA